HPDGNIWFVETGANALGRLAPDGSIVEFPVPTPNASLRGVTVGADGDLWFTENFANKIGRMAPNSTVFGEYAIPTAGSGPALHHRHGGRALVFHRIRRRLDWRNHPAMTVNRRAV
ncbi:MAG TPA: hypothetical protein VMV19_11475, partial [Xanthobacteraceae bacterium]|nr:hypothetical protein [Xanthobacteraceae bacterium]